MLRGLLFETIQKLLNESLIGRGGPAGIVSLISLNLFVYFRSRQKPLTSSMDISSQEDISVR